MCACCLQFLILVFMHVFVCSSASFCSSCSMLFLMHFASFLNFSSFTYNFNFQLNPKGLANKAYANCLYFTLQLPVMVCLTSKVCTVQHSRTNPTALQQDLFCTRSESKCCHVFYNCTHFVSARASLQSPSKALFVKFHGVSLSQPFFYKVDRFLTLCRKS